MDVPEPYCHGYLERLAYSAGYTKGQVEVDRLNNARMATMHVLRTTGLGNSQERLDKAMEILNSVEGGE